MKNYKFMNEIMFNKKVNYKPIVIKSIGVLLFLILFSLIFNEYRIVSPFRFPLEKRQPRIEIREVIVTPTPEPTEIITPTPTEQPKKKLQSFKKYLTPEGFQAREKVLEMARAKYTGDDLIAFDNLMKKEAGYQMDIVNSIGACGMGQAYPCEKMQCPLDYTDEAIECQYKWVTQYIDNRYKTPSLAWAFHVKNNWY